MARVDLNEMLVFTRVVQAQGFTAGARRLGMPRSSVSRKVSDLEDRLGYPTTRHLSPEVLSFVDLLRRRLPLDPVGLGGHAP